MENQNSVCFYAKVTEIKEIPGADKIEQLKEIKLRYPLTRKIRINYSGSFGDCEIGDYIDDERYNIIKIKEELYENICKWVFTKDDMVGFSDEGCYGVVILDLINLDIILKNTYKVLEEIDSKGYKLSEDVN